METGPRTHDLRERVLHLRTFDSDQLMEAVQGARFEHFMLEKSHCEAKLDRWSTEEVVVDRGRYSFPVRAMGPFPKGKICLGYMRGSQDGANVNGFHVTSHTLEIYPDGSELDYRASADSEWLAIELDPEALQRVAKARLGREVSLPWKHIESFEATTDLRTILDMAVRRLWTPASTHLPKIEPILGIVAETLGSLEGATPLPRMLNWKKREALLKRVDHILRSHPEAPFDLPRLASMVGSTPRTLQREFLNVYGITPRQWARCFALHRVRADLLKPEDRKYTVESIAYRHGFRHMGRFASYYRELFGENPSDTADRRA